MGRSRTKKVVPTKATHPPSQPHNESPSKAKPPSIQSLLAKAETLIEQCDYEMALRFTRRILEQEPTHVVAKEMLGVSLLETGDLMSAKEVFLSLIPPSSSAPASPPPSAYLYLAQLSDDEPRLALQCYQSAIDIFTSQLKGKERATTDVGSDDESELKNNAIRALIAMVEIWMDPSYDLCFDPAAEKTCEDILAMALQMDSENAEALQALASVRMSQQRPEEARECLEKSWTSWKDLDADDPRLPPLPTRLALVKLFLELSLFTPALLVLRGVMEMDDQEVEAWYLEGWCFFLMSEKAQESGGQLDDLTWQELAKDARDCLETCRVLHSNQEYPDHPLLEHVNELISKLEELGIKASPVVEAEDDEGGDWEDFEGSEDEDGDVEMS